MAQAASFFSLEVGWAATETQLIQTQDGGNTWRMIGDTPVPFFRLDFISPEDGWALSQDSLFVTHDGGITWSLQLAGIVSNGSSFWKPEVDFLNARVGWLAESGRVFQTHDRGQTWQIASIPQDPRVLMPAEYSLSFLSPEMGWVMRAYVNQPAAALALFKTQDGGKTWEPVAYGSFNDTNGTLPSFRGPDEIYFVDELHGFFVGGPNIPGWETTDGGKTWDALPGSLANQLGGGLGPHQLHMFNPLQGIAVNLSGSCTIIRTDDGGKSWSQLFPPLYPTYDIKFFDQYQGYGLVDEYRTRELLSTRDGGATWQPVRALPCEVQFFGVNAAWGVCAFDQYYDPNRARLYHSSVAGASWQAIATPADLISVNAYFMDDRTGIVWDFWGHVFGTQDGGTTWLPVQPDQGRFPLLVGQAGWFLGNDTTVVYHIGQDDPAWVPVLKANLIDLLNPVSDRVAYVSSDFYSELLKTVDGGRTWTRILLDGIIHEGDNYFTFNFVDEDHGWLVSDQGVFRTTDGGQSWDQILPKIGR